MIFGKLETSVKALRPGGESSGEIWRLATARKGEAEWKKKNRASKDTYADRRQYTRQ
jgi:hypothetical protein